MLNVEQFRLFVVRPALVSMGRAPKDYPLWSQAAENLLIGTALVESRLTHLHQLGGGPALGLYQIEPETHDDLYRNTLKFNAQLVISLKRTGVGPSMPLLDQLVTNMSYATGIARLLYWRIPEPLPEAWDQKGLAGYWKDWFNTEAGAGDPADFVSMYEKYGRKSEPAPGLHINHQKDEADV